jgi:hypothetical protein
VLGNCGTKLSKLLLKHLDNFKGNLEGGPDTR